MSGKSGRAVVSAVEEGGRVAVTRLELTVAQTKRAGQIIASAAPARKPVTVARRVSGPSKASRAKRTTA